MLSEDVLLCITSSDAHAEVVIVQEQSERCHAGGRRESTNLWFTLNNHAARLEAFRGKGLEGTSTHLRISFGRMLTNAG